jgi:hypothetical protein
VWQTDARNWPGIDISGVEQGQERALRAVIQALSDQPAIIVFGAGSRCEHRLTRLALVRGLGPRSLAQSGRLGSGCGRKTRGTARHNPSALGRDGAHSNAVIGQEYHSPGFERASDGAYGCRFWTQRSSSKSSMSRWRTHAALASLQTDQLSNVRAERHWEAVIIIALFPFILVGA